MLDPMRTHAPTMQSIEDAPSTHSAVDLPGVADTARAVDDFIQTQEALGTPWVEIVGMAAAIYGQDHAKPLWDAEIAQIAQALDTKMFARTGARHWVVSALDTLARTSPGTALAWLHDALANGTLREWVNPYGNKGLFLNDLSWITSLPTSLKVKGDLALKGCTSLETLPDNLRVGRHLHLDDCRSLRSLPAGLVVRSAISLLGCTAWDGRIPEDARIGGAIRRDPPGKDETC